MMMQTIDDPAIVAAYLRTLPAIRERCTQVFELARQDKLEFFAYHPEKEAECAKFCDDLITVCCCCACTCVKGGTCSWVGYM
jgi:hypothetical protein